MVLPFQQQTSLEGWNDFSQSFSNWTKNVVVETSLNLLNSESFSLSDGKKGSSTEEQLVVIL